MKVTDIIFALISGWMVNWVAFDFLKGYGVDFGLWRWLLSWVLPIVSLTFLWIAYLASRKLLFVYQGAKHLLVGAFATVIDLEIFELLVWVFSLAAVVSPIFSKGISFLISTSVKYWGNKHWAFGKFEKEELPKEIFQFFIVTVVGLGLDIGSFFYFTKIMGPQFGTPLSVWVELSVILAAIVAALWNFCGYKFLVFKK